jgi:hypothetical protein
MSSEGSLTPHSCLYWKKLVLAFRKDHSAFVELRVVRKEPSASINLHVTKAYAIKFAGHGCLLLSRLLNEGWGSPLWSPTSTLEVKIEKNLVQSLVKGTRWDMGPATSTIEVKPRKDLLRFRVRETRSSMGKQNPSRQHNIKERRVLSTFQMVAETGK